MNKFQDDCGSGQGTSVEYEVNDGHRESHHLTTGNDAEEDWRDD